MLSESANMQTPFILLMAVVRAEYWKGIECVLPFDLPWQMSICLPQSSL